MSSGATPTLETVLQAIDALLSSNDVTSLYLLDILRFIAEELNSKALRLGLNRRHSIKADLEQRKNLVSDFLIYKMKNADPQTLSKIFKCLTSWWDSSGIMTEGDVRAPLLEGAFYVLQNPESFPKETCEDASDWIISLISYCPTISGYHSEMLKVLQVSIYALLEVFQRCCLQASKTTDETVAEGFVQRASLIGVIFAELTNAVRKALAKSPALPGSGEPGDLRTLDCLLSVLEAPPPVGCISNVRQTFDALDSLAEDAAENCAHSSSQQNTSGNTATGDWSPTRANSRALLVPYFTRVVSALARLSVKVSDDLEAADEVRDFREEVYSVMVTVVDMVDADTIFTELFNRIKQLQEMGNTGNVVNLHREVEACLFMMTTVARRLSLHDPENRISSLITTFMLPVLTSKPSASMQEVFCMLFSELAQWIVLRPEIRRQVVEQLIQIVEGAVDIPETQLQSDQQQAVCEALLALGKLCQSCRARTVKSPNSDPTTNGNGSTPCAGLLDEHWKDLIFRVAYAIPRLAHIPTSDIVKFYEGIVRGLMTSISYRPDDGFSIDPRPARAALPERLADLLSVNIQCITKLIEQNQPIVFKDRSTDPTVYLDAIASIFRSMVMFLIRLDDTYRRSRLDSTSANEIDQQRQAEVNSLSESAQACLNGCLNVATSALWPVIARCLERYSSKNHIMERCCRVIRFVVRTFSVNLRDILPDIANKLVQSYQQDQHSCFLYLASVLTDVFADLPECRPGLVSLFEAIAPPTLASLNNSLTELPYVVEDFFRLCIRLVQRCPSTFLASPNVDVCALLNTALEFLNLFTLNPPSSESEDESDNENAASNDPNKPDPKANNSATGAVAHFLQEALQFASKFSEDTPAAIIAERELPQLTNEAALGARRLMFWVLKPVELCGGQRVTTTCVHSCCNGLCDELFPDVASLLMELKMMVPRDLFSTWMDRALGEIPVVRTDGLVQATAQQLADFKDAVMIASRGNAITRALDAFVVLFR
ncbi:hypothetical protein Aperf_G00000002363 [Anoplocephala perfoliata]